MVNKLSTRATKKELEIIKEQILKFCIKQIEEKGYPPSCEDISKEMEIPMTSTRRYLSNLEEEGRIKRIRNAKGRVMNRTIIPIKNNVPPPEETTSPENNAENENV